MNIYKYCNTTSRSARGGLNPYNSPCAIRNIIPSSKTNKSNTSTNQISETQKMKYSRWVNTYGTAQNSTPAFKTSTFVISRFTY